MTRTTSKHLLAALVVGFGVTLTACGTVVANGNPTPSSSAPTTTTDSSTPTTTDSGSTTTTTKSGGTTTNGHPTTTTKPTTTTTHPTTTTPKPGAKVESFTVVKQPSCPVDPKPGAPFHSPGSPVVIAWKISGAPKAALSVDNPGLYGSYTKDLPATGQLELSFPCTKTPGKTSHTYTIYPAGYPHIYKTITVSAQNNP
jgi:hypothetical protein